MTKSRRIRWAGHVAPTGEKWNAYRVLVGNPEGNRQVGRPKLGWKDNIKMYLKRYRMGCCGLNSSGLG
jgi:hypothetical protein